MVLQMAPYGHFTTQQIKNFRVQHASVQLLQVFQCFSELSSVTLARFSDASSGEPYRPMGVFWWRRGRWCVFYISPTNVDKYVTINKNEVFTYFACCSEIYQLLKWHSDSSTQFNGLIIQLFHKFLKRQNCHWISQSATVILKVSLDFS